MYRKIAHLADIHIPRDIKRHDEVKTVIENTRKALKKENPDLIVVVGDLNHDKIKLETEHLVLQVAFLRMLSQIAPVRITRGNHDFNLKSEQRQDTIDALVTIMDDPNIVYYDKTGFYVDDNITWSVWHHGAENENPWSLGYKRDENQLYIDLFHDPINGALTDTGQEFDKPIYRNLSDFKGDYSFFGDIHKYQTFSEGKRAYSGSLFQQNFGEDVEYHGFLMWDIQTGSHKHVEVENPYSFRKIYLDDIGELEDYDDKDYGEYPRFRIYYYVSRQDKFDKSLEKQISKYFKTKHNAILVDIKKREHTDNIDYSVFSELNENVYKGELDKDVVDELLYELGYDDEFIKDFFSLDEEVNERLAVSNDKSLTTNNINILKIEFDNFKAYGDDNTIDWTKLDGITTLAAANRTGKSTVIDVILFNLFGKTLFTSGKGKDKINLFNQNRDKDYVNTTGYYSINGSRFAVKRCLKRKKNRNDDYKVEPVDLSFYSIDKDNNIVDKLNEEKSAQINKTIENNFGTYGEFMRNNVITNGLILEYLSSKDSVFVDALLKDTGLFIYDYKLQEVKEIRKKYINEGGLLSLDLGEEREKIEDCKNLINQSSERLTELNSQVSNLSDRITKGQNKIKEKYQEFTPVDDDIVNLDVDSLRVSIDGIASKIGERGNVIKSLSESCEGVDVDVIEKQINDHQIVCGNKRDNVYSNEIKLNALVGRRGELTSSITSLVSLKEYKGKEKKLAKNESINRKNELDQRKKNHIERLNGLMEQKSFIGSQYDDITNMDVCPHCNKRLNKHSDDEIKEHKNELESKLQAISNEIDKLNTWLGEYDNTVEEIKKDYRGKVKAIDQEIDQANIDITQKTKEKGEVELEIESLNKTQEMLRDEVKMLENTINTLTKQKDDVYRYVNAKDSIDNMQQNLEYKRNQLVRYEKSVNDIEHNKKVQADIDKFEKAVQSFEYDRGDIQKEVNDLQNEIDKAKEHIVIIEENIEKHNEQQRKLKLYDEYEKIVHRKGLPSMLLQKMVPTINSYLSNVISDISFDLYLNDDFKLMMQNHSSNKPQSAMQGSGAEKAFSVIALKIALKMINKNIKYNLMFMDECFANFDAENKDNIKSKLQDISQQGMKVCLISHDDSILEIADNIIRPVMDENGITRLE